MTHTSIVGTSLWKIDRECRRDILVKGLSSIAVIILKDMVLLVSQEVMDRLLDMVLLVTDLMVMGHLDMDLPGTALQDEDRQVMAHQAMDLLEMMEEEDLEGMVLLEEREDIMDLLIIMDLLEIIADLQDTDHPVMVHHQAITALLQVETEEILTVLPEETCMGLLQATAMIDEKDLQAITMVLLEVDMSLILKIADIQAQTMVEIGQIQDTALLEEIIGLLQEVTDHQAETAMDHHQVVTDTDLLEVIGMVLLQDMDHQVDVDLQVVMGLLVETDLVHLQVVIGMVLLQEAIVMGRHQAVIDLVLLVEIGMDLLEATLLLKCHLDITTWVLVQCLINQISSV